jgi:hypothetical protein
LQAAQIFFNGGIVTLQNADNVDYKQKTSHNFNVGTNWSNSAATPWSDLAAACQLNREDGKVAVGEFVAVFGETAWENYLTRSEGRNDVLNVKLDDISPPVMNTEGAAFHGIITAGSYRLQAWTYPQVYEVPTAADLGGLTLPNAGTLQPFVPADHVLVVPPSNAIDLRLVFAGIPRVVPAVDPGLIAMGLTRVPQGMAGDFHPYTYVDDKKATLEVGVQSAPLAIPTQIDGFTTMDTEI